MFVLAIALLAFPLPEAPDPTGDTALGFLTRIKPPGQVNMNLGARASAFGDIDSDLRQDVVLQVGSKAWALLAPGVLDVWMPLDSAGSPAVRDVATWNGWALVADANGISRFRISPDSGLIEHKRLVSGIDAQELVVGDVTADGQADLVVRTASEVRTYRDAGGDHFTCIASFSVPSTTKSIRIVQWNSPAIAVLGSNSLSVHRLQGTVVHARQGKGSATVLDAGRSRVDGNSVVVWGSRNAAGQEWLHVEREGQPSEPAVALGSPGLRSIRLADVDFDGDDDLIASLSNQPSFLLMGNRSELIQAGTATAHFLHGATGSVLLQIAVLGSNNSNQHAEPVLADFDNDMDVDLFMGVQSSGDFILMANFPIDEDLFYFRSGESKDQLYLELPTAGIPMPATHFVLMLFERKVTTSDYYTTLPLRIVEIKKNHLQVQVVNGWPCIVLEPVSTDNGWLPGQEAQGIMWFEKRDGATGQVLERYPSTVLSIPISGGTDGSISGVTRVPKLGPFPPGLRPIGGGTAGGTGRSIAGN